MADNTKLRIAMFPWLAFGHMIPWLQLAKLIAQKASWLPTIARQLGIPHGFFSIFNAAVLGYFGPPSALINRADHDLNTPEDYTRQPKWVPFPTTVAFRLFEARRIFHGITGDESNVSDSYRFGETLRSCDIIPIRSCVDFEPEWLKVLEDIHRKPVIPVGQLPTTADDAGEETDTWRWIKEWLDKQEKGSTVYVAFGSEAQPSQEELTKIAFGLELSGLPFFWVLKKRLGPADTKNSVAESLRLVVVEEEGKFYREKAMEMRGLFGDRDR
ncbi:hypothetical protein Pint_26420 [Pistacia integerrima]|uniref:Uncharacterized protein n=1 Tax=Pistacia integerrima TaxID=434235 RepID=A0ACC0YE75_9ROSI|nr:hypothetical protein Pint_26420 [Pistacia integerrima]